MVTIFNGVFTVNNPKTNQHRTFRIRTQSKDARWMPGMRVISLLTGPDNTSNYESFGFVGDTGIKVWRKKRGGLGLPSAHEKFAVILQSLFEFRARSPYAHYGLTLQESCTCIFCNRALTDPLSIATGIGPECAKARNINREAMPKRAPMTAIDSIVVATDDRAKDDDKDLTGD